VEDQRPFVSWLWQNSWWGKRPTLIRHFAYWTIALGLISATAFDRTTAAPTAHSSGADALVWLIFLLVVVIALAIMGLVATLLEWQEVGAARTTSRSLVIFTLLLGVATALLFYARRWGVHIEACHTVGELEICQGQAAPRQVLGILAWHAANVVPVLDITHSLEWHRPARSAHAVVGASVLALRLWVAMGILAVLKRLWDKWAPGGPSRTVSH
jgi:hypothetical protein